MMIEAWHADSLAGLLNEMKKAFEAKNTGAVMNLTSCRSKELAERILRGRPATYLHHPIRRWLNTYSARRSAVRTPHPGMLSFQPMNWW